MAESVEENYTIGLLDAARGGSAPDVRAALETLDEEIHVDVLVDELGRSALQLCCMNGHRECARLLLYSGASVSHQAFDGSTPLYTAVLSNWNHFRKFIFC